MKPVVGSLLLSVAWAAANTALAESAPAPVDAAPQHTPAALQEAEGQLRQQSPDYRFQAAIMDLESRFGGYAAGLAEQLSGLGAAYQTRGSHLEAAAVLKRALHLARVNYGLHSPEQIPILQQLIHNLISSGDYQTADERYDYLYRLQHRIFGPAAPQISVAMLERARWEEQAYFLLPDKETAFGRLLAMWELYVQVLNRVIRQEGSFSPKLLEPLHGLLITQYLISTYAGGQGGGIEVSAGLSRSVPAQDQFDAVRVSNYRRGQKVLASLRELHTHNEPAASPLPAESLLELGDWHLWHRKQAPARLAYQQAWDELTLLEDREELLQQHFGKPVLLPTLSGYNKDLGAPATIKGHVEVSFTITESGRVADLDTINTEWVDGEGRQASPSKLLRRLRKTIWRPRLLGRVPVTTENMVMRYAF